MQKQNSFIQTFLVFLILTQLWSCNIFQKTESANESSRQKDVLASEGADFYTGDPNFPNDLFDEENPYSMAPSDTTMSYDTISFMESTGYSDTMIMFSNRELNNNLLALEIVRECPAVQVLDSLVNIKFFNDENFTADRDKLNIYNYEMDFIPDFPDSVYEARIAQLNRRTPFELTYNKTIRNFIELYTMNKRNLSSRILGLSEVYFPMFEEVLDQYNMPLELKYLAVVESALVPNAGSRAGAKGLWQFMYRTGKVYGLEVTTMVDDRYDPYKSTIAAAQHLKDLYDIYQNWSLALAAYNSGAGNVNKAIRRAGGVKNYWAIWPYLPRETRGYVPAFIAVYYMMNYSAEHNIFPADPGILDGGIDTVHVNDLLSFDQISEFLSIPYDDVKFLNPSFKLGIIPADNNNNFVLRLPREHIGEFVSNENEIYTYKTTKGIERDKLLAQIEQAKQRDIHYVKSGETLGHIAKIYHTSVNNLKSWNNLKSSTIYPGQKLIVYASPGSTTSTKESSSSSTVQRSGEKAYHVVKNGENLGLIAKKYKCSTTDLENWNNLSSSTIHPKQKLIVYKPLDASQPNPEEASINSGNVKYVYHTVKSGDTLWEIAKQYDGVTVNQIKQLNNITNSNKIKPGQKLKVSVSG